MHAVSAMFDINPSMSTHMPVALWHKAACTLLRIFKLLADNPHISVSEMADPEAKARAAPIRSIQIRYDPIRSHAVRFGPNRSDLI